MQSNVKYVISGTVAAMEEGAEQFYRYRHGCWNVLESGNNSTKLEGAASCLFIWSYFFHLSFKKINSKSSEAKFYTTSYWQYIPVSMVFREHNLRFLMGKKRRWFSVYSLSSLLFSYLCSCLCHTFWVKRSLYCIKIAEFGNGVI